MLKDNLERYYILKKIRLKKEMTNFLLVLIVILITGSANVITISNVTLIVVMLLTIVLFIKRKEKIDKSFYVFTLIYFIIYSIHALKFNYIDLREFREFLKIFYAYIFIKLVYKDFFKLYTNIIYKLAIISLPLYFLQLIDYNLMKSLIGILEHNISFLDYREDWYENIFFFTLNDNGMYRNSGFAWEPKGFGTFLTLAFFIQLTLNKFQLFDKKNLIYFIAIITTLSTATYTIFLFTIIPFYLYNKQVSYKIITSIFLLPLIFISFTKLDFLKEKIIHEYETRDKFVKYVDDTKYQGDSRSLGRFGSFLVDYSDLKKEPILGYGLYSDKRTMYTTRGVKLVRVNGFSDFSAKFGLVGLIFLILALSYSFKKIATQFTYKGYLFIPLSILITSFGSAILLKPLYLGLIFYAFVRRKSQKYNIPPTKK